ncbi:hypothetical protein ANN_09635 [Periplaneta americana]|uniref:HTH CENPB-type domain-containing protein n=1 Tax=Periplaneta americana TaxID=6978 RepID=A0ABQ8TLU7_PERAM|nr:hypothetical protein ANN_09635 [Periplaneta americana]
MDLREVGYDDREWINLAQDRDRWRAYESNLLPPHVSWTKVDGMNSSSDLEWEVKMEDTPVLNAFPVVKCEPEENGVKHAGREFDVEPKLVRYWRSQKEQLEKAKLACCLYCGPRCCKYPEIDRLVLDYIMELRNDGFAVKHEMIQFKAREAAAKRGITGAADFKASYSFYEEKWAESEKTNNSSSTSST